MNPVPLVKVYPERVLKKLDGAHDKILQQMVHFSSANERFAVPSLSFSQVREHLPEYEEISTCQK